MLSLLIFTEGQNTYENVGSPLQVAGDIAGVKIMDMASRSDCVLALSDTGEVSVYARFLYSKVGT